MSLFKAFTNKSVFYIVLLVLALLPVPVWPLAMYWLLKAFGHHGGGGSMHFSDFLFLIGVPFICLLNSYISFRVYDRFTWLATALLLIQLSILLVFILR